MTQTTMQLDGGEFPATDAHVFQGSNVAFRKVFRVKDYCKMACIFWKYPLPSLY
jgi:hypothetical protein